MLWTDDILLYFLISHFIYFYIHYFMIEIVSTVNITQRNSIYEIYIALRVNLLRY